MPQADVGSSTDRPVSTAGTSCASGESEVFNIREDAQSESGAQAEEEAPASILVQDADKFRAEPERSGSRDLEVAPPLADDPALADPWNLVRTAMGSLAGEAWRVKQALTCPSEAFELAPGADTGMAWELFKGTQSFDDFRKGTHLRPNSTNNIVDIVILGSAEALMVQMCLDVVVEHVQAFVGFKVAVRPGAVGIGPWAHKRTGKEGHSQVGAHHLLAHVQNLSSPRSVCTIGITTEDLYPPKVYDFVTGISDASHRVAVYSVARFFMQPGNNPPSKEQLSACMVISLCRECCKMVGMGECRLLRCLMNPFPGGPPQAIRCLPLMLCCVCLRKLQWVAQIDLLDRYARLPATISQWFLDEAIWLNQRMCQCGMPTYASLQHMDPEKAWSASPPG